MTNEFEARIASSGSVPLQTHCNIPAGWRIEVRSEAEADRRFRAAFAIDSELKLIESTTPFDFEFSASKFSAFFEVESDGSLNVSAYSDTEGDFRRICGFTAPHGKVIFDPYGLDGHILCGAGTRL